MGQAEYNAQELFKDTEGYLDKMVQASGQVKMYVKLPSSFCLHTPLGSYNPDWALVLETEGKNSLYFVTETRKESP